MLEGIRQHGSQMSLPSLEESERIIAQAQLAMEANPNPRGGCCGG